MTDVRWTPNENMATETYTASRSDALAIDERKGTRAHTGTGAAAIGGAGGQELLRCLLRLFLSFLRLLNLL
eukprot:SAG11_NODE_37310_length_257_cov_0.987342_1_plen_70_part_01